MTAGPANRKPRGLGLRELPPSISWLRSASPSSPSEGKQCRCSAALVEIAALCVTLYLIPNFSLYLRSEYAYLTLGLSHIFRLFPVPQDDESKSNAGVGPASGEIF